MRRFALALAAAAAASAACVAHAQAASEASVKAAFLYRFAAYVEWPAAALPPAAPFVIAVAGAEDVAAELERVVQGRSVQERKVVVRRVREADSFRGVHIAFIGRGEAQGRALARAAQQAGALVVTDSERGLELGGAINFVLADDRMGFEVSLDNAERAGLRISSRMLAVARRVVPKS